MNALKLSCGVAAVIVLAACGGSDNERPEPAYPPALGVSFPPAIVSTTSDSVTIHATALGLSNPLTTVAASLNDVAVGQPALPNAKHRYQFDVTGMTAGSQNTIKVTASDANISQSTTHDVTYGASWMVERGVQYDAINDRALVVDAAKKAILAINLTTGEKTELSSLDVGSGANLAVPEDMALDGSDSVWVVDSGLQQLVKINLSNGQRSAFYDGGQSDSDNKFNQPIAVALNGDATTPATIAFVLDVKNKKIHQVDLTNGTDAGDPLPFSDRDSGINLILPLDLVYDDDNERLLITDSATDSIIAIETDGTEADGARSALVGGSALDDRTPFSALQNITLLDNNSAYVSDLNYGVAEVNIGPTMIKFIPSTVFLRPGETRKVVVSIDEPLCPPGDEAGSLVIGLDFDNAEFTSNVTQIEWTQKSCEDEKIFDEKIFYISAKEGSEEAQSIEISADDVITNAGLYQDFDLKFTAIIVENNPSLSPSALTVGPGNQLLVVDNYLGVIVQVATENDSPVFKGQRDYVEGGASTSAEGDTAFTLTALAADHLMGRLSGLASNANQSVLYTIDRDLGEVKQLVPALNAVVPMYDLTSNTILGSNGELRFSDSGLLAALSNVNTSEEDGTYADINSTGGSGSDAVFELTVNNGEVTAIQVTTAGEAYAYGDTLTLGLSGDTDFSSLSLTLVNDVVQLTDPRTIASRFGVKLGPSGQLYAQSDWLIASILDHPFSLSNLVKDVYPNISAESNRNGVGAVFTITVNDEQQITSIEVDAAGSGYINGEALTFNGEDFGASGSFTLILKEVLQDIYIVDAASEDGQGSVIQINAMGVYYDFIGAFEANRTLLPSPSPSSSDTDFIDPVTALVVDENLYVLDASNGNVITVSLNESSLGDRSLLASISDARAMVLDEAGDNFYVATNNAIKELSLDGVISPTDPVVFEGQFEEILDLVLDDDRLLILDAGSTDPQSYAKVFKVSLNDNDNALPIELTRQDGSSLDDQFIRPTKMIYDSNYQWLYVLDDTLRSLFVVDLQVRDYGGGDVQDSAEVDAQKVVIMQGTALNQ